VLAHATFDHDETAGLALYERAAEGFVRSAEARGEVIARQNLRNMYRLRGEFDAARRQVERAVAVAEASAEPMTIARASVMQADQMMETGGDIGHAHRALLRARRLADPQAPIGLRRAILVSLANASLYLGRIEEAIDALERHRALRMEDGSTVDAAAVAFNLLNARVTASESRPVRDARRQLVAEAESVLAEARNLKHVAVEAQAHRLLGELVRADDPDRAHVHLRRCLALETSLAYPNVRASCLWSLAFHQSTTDRPGAEQLSREAMSLAAANRGGPLLAYAWQSRLRLVWRTLPEDQAITESLAALDAIERMRSGQSDLASRAAMFSNWTREYHWTTGRLLEARGPRLAAAIAVGERMRSRVLLEFLAQAGVPATGDPRQQDAREQLTRRVAETQRVLASPSLGVEERRAFRDRLDLLDLELGALDADRIQAIPSSNVSFASLDTIQQSLDEREALLWFSIAPWKDLYDDFGGGSWVVSVTRRATTIHPLRTGVELDTQVGALNGLLRNRQTRADVWLPAARRLGTMLLGDAVSQLPRGVERLVIVSDGALHRLPFEALTVDSIPVALGDRFEISMVPSATLWLRLRQSPVPPPAAAALVLADPDLTSATSDTPMRLAPLPWARQEARAIASLLDLDARYVLEGAAASEHTLKTASPGTFGILHLAAHARADATNPARSAVFLSPGDVTEDGWLQPREIAALDLRGRLVVLPACESADGSVVGGEGPLSLARAFFAGGAAAVVATRWPLRDDDAAFLMERFYRRLAAGDSAGVALRGARRDAIDTGLPAAAWAGIALLGDGLQRPVRTPHRSAWAQILVIAVIPAIVVLAWMRRQRRQ
jgi:CHAT domain-containing protein